MRTAIFATVLGLVCLLRPDITNAQQSHRGVDLSFIAGMNIGATTPVPIPGALNITGYNPRYNPKVGANVAWYFNEHWGVGAGLTLDWKAMKVNTRVTDVHLSIDVPNVGTLTGYVTGKNMTKVNTMYLVQPIYGSYRFNDKWSIKGGIYLAESLKRKFKGRVTDVVIKVETPITQERDIPYATLDYSDHARKFDMGVLAGGEFRMNDHVGFFADFTWGLTPYFSGNVPITFTMRNVYFSFGATFRL